MNRMQFISLLGSAVVLSAFVGCQRPTAGPQPCPITFVEETPSPSDPSRMVFEFPSETERDPAAHSVQLEASWNHVRVGEPVFLRVKAENVKLAKPLDFPNMPGLKADPSPKVSHELVACPDRGTKTVTTFEYELTPTAPGEHVVPAFEIAAGPRVYKTQPIVILAEDKQPHVLEWSGAAGSPSGTVLEPAKATTRPEAATAQASSQAAEKKPLPKRYTYTPKVYPVDERGFSPVDKNLAKAMAREEIIADDEEGSLNPYVMRVVASYPLDGTYPYHCGWTPREYDIYNGVTQDMWYKGLVVAKAYPDGSRCSYCCGLTFEIFLRAMKLRNIQKGLDPDDFNGMTFNDVFNMLQLWYIEGEGDCERRAITSYGLGRAIEDFEEVKPGDFLSYSTTPAGGHSVVFIDWIREDGKIVGLKYFSSNLSGSKGVGYGQGRFSDSNQSGKGLLRKSLRIARVGNVKSYMSFNRMEIPARNAYAPTQPTRIIYVPATQPAGSTN